MVRRTVPSTTASHTSHFLCTQIRQLASKHDCRYTDAARTELLQLLFHSLTLHREDYFRLLFRGGQAEARAHEWKLTDAQGAVDGAEYTEAAKGKRCGHIFKNGEATYYCRTCAADDTCVLCAKCFEASDHEGHQVSISTSGGSFGCCDCGDDEAWQRPVKCSIHSALEQAGLKGKGRAPTSSSLPQDLQDSVRATIGRVFDFICDVFSSAAPEHMRAAKQESRIRSNERLSRLKGKWYQGTDENEVDEEFALLLWNDEKHTLDEVQDQVAKALKKKRSYGLEKATEVDDVGRSIVDYSKNVPELIAKAKILEQIKVTVTIRSTRDTFREQMCSTLVDWLCDVSGCSVGTDHFFLMNVVCEELLKPWKIGSGAPNLQVAPAGIRDEVKSDDRLQRMRENLFRQRMQRQVEQAREATAGNPALAGRVAVGVVDGPDGPVQVTLPMPMFGGGANDTVDEASSGEEDQDEDAVMADATPTPGEATVNPDAARQRLFDELMAEGDEDMGFEDFEDVYEDDDENDEAGAATEITNAHLMGDGDTAFRSQSPDVISQDGSGPSESDAPAASVQNDSSRLITAIPRTPKTNAIQGTAAPAYWSDRDSEWRARSSEQDIPVYEDLNKRVRMDFLILYDLRMWKTLRDSLRHLYISTVITVPYFKRVLGLRFASVYTYLAQLYLIGDREPDHSIINVSLQMLTTPSITAEIVERGSFFTKLLAILYTFLTKRQVGHPADVDLTATMSLDSNVMNNRRIYHFFHDLKYLLESPYVKKQIREHEEYLQQCLDFIKLYQGICPNVRAVNEHVEFESDVWISASIIGRDMTKMTRHFCEAFEWTRMQDPTSITRAIRQAGKACIINSMGAEIQRFPDSVLKHTTKFHTVAFNKLHVPNHIYLPYKIVEFEVENEPMSFHYTLHYVLSWLIDCGKSMSKAQLRGLLEFSHDQLQKPDLRSHIKYDLAPATFEEYQLSLFDVPLRVCAWLAQMRAGMWVRNGMTLRHQMQTFRSTSARETSHQRDIFMLQVGLVVLPPSAFLVSMIDRYGLTGLLTGDFTTKPGWEDHHVIDMAEDFIHLLIVLLSDRALLLPAEEEKDMIRLSTKKDIAHALCFKPLSHSELVSRLAERSTDQVGFPQILREMTSYRAPEGLNDSGQYELKQEYYDEVDPYNAWYSKNQREEAENMWKQKKAKMTGQSPEDVVYEPSLRKIRNGVFADLPLFTQEPAFAQVIFYTLQLALHGKFGQISSSRFETFLPGALHLVLLAIQEDRNPGGGVQARPDASFIDAALTAKADAAINSQPATVLSTLFELLNSGKYEAVQPKLRVVIHRMADKRKTLFTAACEELGVGTGWMQSRATSSSADNLAEKKQKAMERNARVMANMRQQQTAFEQNQTAIDWGVDEDDLMDDDEVLVSPSKKVWNYPDGTCIFCQEQANDHRLYGTLSFICESSVFRETNLKDPDYVSEALSSPQNLDHSAAAIRPFGVAGRNIQQISRVKADGSIQTTERRGLGKGWPKGFHTKGPVATGCGHLMHFTCFETYCNATARRHSMQVARNHPERIKENCEFVCPLCKALGNAFLPIVFKAKELVHPQSLQVDSFDDFLNNKAPMIRSKGFMSPQYLKIFQNTAKEALVPGLANKVADMHKPATAVGEMSSRVAARSFQLPAFLGFEQRTETSRPSSRVSSSTDLTQAAAMGDLQKAYVKLQESLVANKIKPHFFPAGQQVESRGFASTEFAKNRTLTSALGFSITSIEIAQRGVEATTGSNWISSISELSLTQLRIFASTVSTHLALTGLDSNFSAVKPSAAQEAVIEVQECVHHQIQQLLGHNFHGEDEIPYSAHSLFDRDIFVFLTECTVYVQPHLHLEVQHLLRLCYLAEIVKVIVAFFQKPETAMKYAENDVVDRTTQAGAMEELAKSECTPQQSEAWSGFVQYLYGHCQTYMRMENHKLSNPNERFAFDQFLRVAVSSYLLPFMRKTLLLMHIRFGIDYDASEATWVDADEPELDRLTRALDLPTLDALVGSLSSGSPSAGALDHIVQHWIQHYKWASMERVRLTPPGAERPDVDIRLAHPGIFELVALPQMQDVLNSEAMSRRCPTTGKDMDDANLCLFCGDIFCGQAQCCQGKFAPAPPDRLGGCSQHLARCGGKIGMFLNIRKCCVLFLNERQGSIFPAPYLDEHGETDMGLRHKKQLFLNRRRYDRLLRDAWLGHGIPSAIARKLEGDVNIGGWETM